MPTYKVSFVGGSGNEIAAAQETVEARDIEEAARIVNQRSGLAEGRTYVLTEVPAPRRKEWVPRPVERTVENEGRPTIPQLRAHFSEKATAKDILAAIDRWAGVTTYEQARQLWKVLTALRGPDERAMSYEGERAKRLGTAVIRSASLPTLARKQGALVNKADQVILVERSGNHFNNHLRDAAAVLGLRRADDPLVEAEGPL
jgi:hypothetical protein